MSFGVELSGRQLVAAQQQIRQARDDVKENSAREARNSYSYTTTGSSTFVAQAPITFDCLFIQEPHFTSGVAMVRTPDLNLYDLPMAQVGIYRWVKRPQQPADKTREVALRFDSAPGSGSYRPKIESQPDDTEPMFYTGAYLYFIVRCDLKADLTAAQKALAAKNPASAVLHHHLTFVGQAMKDLSESITRLSQDKAMLAHATPLGVT